MATGDITLQSIQTVFDGTSSTNRYLYARAVWLTDTKVAAFSAKQTASSSYRVVCKIGNLSGTTITWGSEQLIATASLWPTMYTAEAVNSSTIVISHVYATSSIGVRVITVDGSDNITVGSTNAIVYNSIYHSVVPISSTEIAVAHEYYVSSFTQGWVSVYSISGTTLTQEDEYRYKYTAGIGYNYPQLAKLADGECALVWYNNSNTRYDLAHISFDTTISYTTTATDVERYMTELDDNKVVLFDTTFANYNVAELSGGTLSLGSAKTSSNTTNIEVYNKIAPNQICAVFDNNSGSHWVSSISLDDNYDATFDTASIIDSEYGSPGSVSGYGGIAGDSGNGIVISTNVSGHSYDGVYYTFQVEGAVQSDFEYTGSGSVSSSGTAATDIEFTYSGSGTVTASGAADTIREISDYEYSASGSVSSSGTANIEIDLSYSGNGSVSSSGTASIYIEIYEYNGSGGVIASGSAETSYTQIIPSFGDEYVFNSNTTTNLNTTYLSSTKFITVYNDGNNSNYGTAVIGTVDGQDVTYGTPVVINDQADACFVTMVDTDRVVVQYGNIGVVGNISGTTITFQSEYTLSGLTGLLDLQQIDTNKFTLIYNTASGFYVTVATNTSATISYGTSYQISSSTTTTASLTTLSTSSIAISWRDSSGYGSSVIGGISGTVVSLNSTYVFNSASTYNIYSTRLSDTKYVISYRDNGNSNNGTAIVATVSAGVISYGSEYVFSTSACYIPTIASFNDSSFIINYKDVTDSGWGKTVYGSVDGSVISYGDVKTFNSGNTSYISTANLSSTSFVISYQDTGNSNYGTSIIGLLVEDTGENIYTGSGTITTSGEADVETSLVSIYSSSAEVSNAAVTDQFTIRLTDSKFVTLFASESNYCRARVGTPDVNGNPVFGSAYTLNSGSRNTLVSGARLDDNTFVAIYDDFLLGANYLQAVVGTVSGTIISLGSTTDLGSGLYDYLEVTPLSSTSFLVSYTIDDVSKLVVGTVSGTTITFGTEYEYNSGETTFQGLISSYSATSAILAYGKSNDTQTWLRTVSISGTTITFGDEVQSSSYSLGGIDVADARNFLLLEVDRTTNHSYCRYGSWSGTTITLYDRSEYYVGESLYSSVAHIDKKQFIISYATNLSTHYGYGVQCTFADDGTLSFDYTEAFNNNDITGKLNTIALAPTSFVTDWLDNDSTSSRVVIGSSPVSYVGSGTIHVSGEAQGEADYITSGSGTITVSGEATTQSDKYYVASGVVTASGEAVRQIDRNFDASGTVTTSGSAALYLEVIEVGSGSVTASGSADTEYGREYDASGTVTASGSATLYLEVIEVGSGSVVASGDAIEEIGYEFTGSGTTQTSGSVETAIDYIVVGSGGVTTSGNAITSQNLLPTQISYGDYDTFNTTTVGAHTDNVMLTSTTGIVVFRDTGNSNYGTAVIASVSGTTVTHGTEYVYNSDSTQYSKLTRLSDTTFAVVYWNNTTSDYCARIGTVSGSTISFGTEVVLENLPYFGCVAVNTVSSTQFVATAVDQNGYSIKSYVCDVSGSTITAGSANTIDTISVYCDVEVFEIGGDLLYIYANSSNYLSYNFATISGSTITAGTATATTYTSQDIAAGKISDGRIIVSVLTANYPYESVVLIGDISGSTITWGDEYALPTSYPYYQDLVVLDPTHIVFTYRDVNNSNYGTGVVGIITDDALTVGPQYVYYEGSTNYQVSTFISESKFLTTYNNRSLVGFVDVPYIKEYTGSGVVQTSGNAIEIPTAIYVGSGTVNTSGDVDADEVNRVLTGSGTVQSSGEAGLYREIVETMSGGIQTSGDAEEILEFVEVGSGTIYTSGHVDADEVNRELTGFGTVQSSGEAILYIDFIEYAGSGLVQTSGTAPVDIDTYVYEGSGTVATSGHAYYALKPSSKEVVQVESLLNRIIEVDSYINTKIEVESILGREIVVRSYL